MNDMLEGALRRERVRVPHGRYLPRDSTHVHDIAGTAVAVLNVPASQLRHHVFYAASGINPLVNGGQVADIVREMVPGAHIEIGETITPMIERYDLKMRGVHDVRPVEEELGYRIHYRGVRAGMKEYADRYCEFLVSQGKTPAKQAW